MTSTDRLIAAAEEHERAGRLREAILDLERAAQASAPCPGIWLRVAGLEQAADRYRSSRAACLNAAVQARGPRGDAILGPLLMRLLGFEETAAIRTVCAGADYNSPAVLRQSAVIAQVLWLAGLNGEVLEFLDHVERRVRPDHRLALVRGSALRTVGRMEDATRAYERAIQLEPGFVDAHWALASHDPTHRPDEQRAAIAHAMAKHPSKAAEQAELGYARFHVEDAAGRHDQAWEALQVAASIKRAHVRRTEVGDNAVAERIEGLPLDLPPVRDPAEGEVRPVFIVGMPRTGTTLLERILGNHVDVYAAGELNAFAASVAMAMDAFPKPRADPTLAITLGSEGHAQTGREYLRRIGQLGSGRACVVDKNPQNLAFAGVLAKALPSARILCMVRDPMDACFSNYKALFSGDAYGYSYDFDSLAVYHHAFERQVAHWAAAMPQRFQVVQYESLVANPVEVSQQVMSFCGLDAQPDCVDIMANRNPVSTASSSQVRRPINDRGIGAWRRYGDQLAPLATRLAAGYTGVKTEAEIG